MHAIVYLVAIAWIYVAVMMAAAEASHSQGSLLGALITFILYGVLPLALVLYLLATPMRSRARRQRERVAEETAAAAPASDQPDGSGHTTAAAQGEVIAPVRKEP